LGSNTKTKKKPLMKKIFKFCVLINFISIFFFIYVNASEIYHKNKLEKYFKDLKNSKNLDEAISVEKNIWNLWISHPDNQFLTNKLELGTELMENGQHKYAYKIFSNIIFDDPNWSEAWNKRATVLFLMKEYDLSLVDIEKTLDLEPRHFGALSGRAQIYINKAEYKKALDNLIQNQKIYPLAKGNEVILRLQKILNIEEI
tara:strand:- start:234 stop:836 length:603 start_codon:yes stop_codon:yes gene_type:complete